MLVRTITYVFKSAELFGSFSARILLVDLEISHKGCLCIFTFLGVLQYFLLAFAHAVNLPFHLIHVRLFINYLILLDIQVQFIISPVTSSYHSVLLPKSLLSHSMQESSRCGMSQAAWRFCQLLTLRVANSFANFILELSF